MRKGNQQIARILKCDLRHEVKLCVNSNYCWTTNVDLMDEWSDSWAEFLWCKGEKVLIAWTFCWDILKMGQQPGGKCNYTSTSLQASKSILPQLNPVSGVSSDWKHCYSPPLPLEMRCHSSTRFPPLPFLAFFQIFDVHMLLVPICTFEGRELTLSLPKSSLKSKSLHNSYDNSSKNLEESLLIDIFLHSHNFSALYCI